MRAARAACVAVQAAGEVEFVPETQRSGVLRIIPLGGLGEIGLNCLIVQFEEHAFAIDCGLMFPEQHMLGIDRVIPDPTFLKNFAGEFHGYVVTHGHEDHIGALPYLLRERDAPVYAPPMAAGLITERLREHGLLSDTDLHVTRPRRSWEMGPFTIEPVHMTHSIVDACGLIVRTPIGTIVHSGDFKLDETPIDGSPSDLQRLAEIGDEGVLLLLSDSTNVERIGRTPSERTVRDGLDAVFTESPGRVFFSTFSSHVHRIRQVVELSQRYERRIAVVGRSLNNSIRIATQLGYLEYPPSLFVDFTEAARMERNRVTMLITGSQGEPLSALIRIAEGDHPHVKMEPDDSVILSARVIPGNEKTIANMINHIYRRGARPYHGGNSAHVHTSGHASRGELAVLMQTVRPRYFLPVHGEYRHLAQHQALAQEVGIAEEATFLLEDGDVLELAADGARRVEPVTSGRVFVDGKGVGDVERVVLRDRKHLSSDGLVLAVLAIDQHSGEIISGPDLLSRGLMLEEQGQAFLDEATTVVRARLAQMSIESRTDSLEVKEEVRKALKRFFAKSLDRRPVIVPFVMEM